MSGHETEPIQLPEQISEQPTGAEPAAVVPDRKVGLYGRMIAQLSQRDLERVAEVTVPGLI